MFAITAGLILLAGVYTLAQRTPDPVSPNTSEPSQTPQTPKPPAQKQSKASPDGSYTIHPAHGRPIGGVQNITASRRSKVSLRFISDTDTEFHIHGYNQEIPVQANLPRVFTLTANLEGVFEIEDHHQHIPVAILRITPAS